MPPRIETLSHRPLQWCRDLTQDAGYAVRLLWTSTRFTIAALLTVVLGVGANATIFSVLNPLLFKPLPYPEPDRIVNVFRTSPQSDRWPHSAANYSDHRSRNTVFEHLTAMTWRNVSLAEPDQPAERLFAIQASGNFFALFGVEPLLGRAFADVDDQTGSEKVVVLAHGFWQRRFGGDPKIVGRSLRLDGQNATVIGVMPQDFEYPLFWGNVDVWRPLAFAAEQSQNRGDNFLREFARLKPGVTPLQADAAVKTLAKQLLSEHAELGQRESMRVEALAIVSPVMRRVSAMAFGLAFLVLLIACVNLANLQLARTAARAREFAVRGAIGGEKGRLLRQSLTESLVLALAGGALAVPLAYWCTRLIASRQFNELTGVRITLDPASLGFALGCAALTGLVFGVVPAWLASRADLNDALRQNPQSMTSGRAPQRFRHALIVAEIAFALVILGGAASLIRGLQRVGGIDPGWRADGVIAARLNLVGPRYTQPEARRAFFDTLRARAAEMPGIASAAVSSSSVPTAPFGTSTAFQVEGQTDTILAYNERVTPQYFDTLGIPLRRGRAFTDDDRFGRTPVAIVSETTARTLWPNQDPIGKRIGFRAPNPNWREVVGVVGDVTFPAFGSISSVDTSFEVYQPLAQTGTSSVNVLVRTTREPDTVAADLRRVVAAIDRDLPVYGLSTAEAAAERTTANFQLLANVLGGFAVLGLVLAAIGIFGVVSYSTAQRAPEIGLRVALGASQSEVLWLVLRQGVGLIAVGAIVGLTGGLGVGRLLAALMPRLPSPESAVIVGTAVFMVVVALLAFYIPARRASKISPMLLLRHE